MELTNQEKKMLAVVYTGADYFAYPTKLMAKLTGMSDKVVRSTAKSLIRKNLLKKVGSGHLMIKSDVRNFDSICTALYNACEV